MVRLEPITMNWTNFTRGTNHSQIVDEINGSLSRVQDAGHDRIAKILGEIGQTAFTDHRFGKRKRDTVSIILCTLAHEATLPSEERDLKIVEDALDHLPSCLIGSVDLLNYLQLNFEELRKFFDLSE